VSDETATAAATAATTTTTERHVIPCGLFRARARRVSFSAEPAPEAPPPPEPVRRPAKVARMLALAHHLQRAIERGDVSDAATVARRLGLTRARVTQLLDLCLLAPDLQEAILALEAVDGAEPMAERALRGVVREVGWESQRAEWERSRPIAGAAERGDPVHAPHGRLDATTEARSLPGLNAARRRGTVQGL